MLDLGGSRPSKFILSCKSDVECVRFPLQYSGSTNIRIIINIFNSNNFLKATKNF